MSDVSFKSFGVFCFSVLCFSLGAFIAGAMLSMGDNDCVFPIAWLIGSIVFGIAMAIAHG